VSVLEVKNLNVSYGDVQVIWDLSFKVESKQIVTIIGPNGAGKSTLMITLMGLLTPKSGEIIYKGKNINDYNTGKRVDEGLVLVPEGRLLFPNMSVKDNLKMGATSKSARPKLNENLDFVYELFPRLYERQTQIAGSMSGGEQQMLAIGMGMMACPTILMLDEPSTGLAPIIVERVLETLKMISQKGITMLLVEQDIFLSLSMANKGYVLENGRLMMEGTGSELLKNEHIKNVYLSI